MDRSARSSPHGIGRDPYHRTTARSHISNSNCAESNSASRTQLRAVISPVTLYSRFTVLKSGHLKLFRTQSRIQKAETESRNRKQKYGVATYCRLATRGNGQRYRGQCLGALGAGCSVGRRRWPGARVAAPARGTPHQYVYLFWRGAVHHSL